MRVLNLVILWVASNVIDLGVCVVNARTSGGNETDRLALLQIKQQVSYDPLRVTTSWNQTLHFCMWHGVSCGKRHQRVSQLNLSSLELQGTVSPSIGNLTFLRVIDLGNNGFRGEIPRQLGRLFRLQELYLRDNKFSGSILDSLLGCSDMRILSLSNNEFGGKIPTELGNMFSKLTELHVNENNLRGTIPPHIGNISSLRGLSMRSNNLEGDIPTSIGRLTRLVYLSLNNNTLSGTIPQSIYNLSSLKMFSVAHNRLQGSLPSNIGLTLNSIEQFIVWGNMLSGPLPISLSNSSNLLLLDISMNRFFGGVPRTVFGNLNKLSHLHMAYTDLGSGGTNDLDFISYLTNCSNLEVLYIDGNNFGGSLPDSIGNLSTSLQHLYIADNQISGTIPPSLENLVGLYSIALYSNQLRGNIPTIIGKLHKLQEVGFGKNRLSGEIPFSIGNLSLLNRLWLEENNFSGNIPASLGDCKRLESLSLHSNALSGSIPGSFMALPSLSLYLRLFRNRLTGSLPSEVGTLRSLVELDVSENNLSGNIPSNLGDCIMLVRLYMSRNRFEGAIPEALSSLKSIEDVNLSNNSLSGPIPKDFDKLVFLKKLNLSYNNLEGRVPKKGVFNNASAVSVVPGNEKLCGGIPELHLASCLDNEPRKERFSFRNKLVVSVVCGLVGVALTSLFLIVWLIKKRKNSKPSNSLWSEPYMDISYADLLQATDSFSRDNLIDTGGFGSVYKAILQPSQTVVAVKVLNLERKGASKSFVAECKTLRNTRHRNLLRIVTVCSSIDHQGNDFKALVYEFMPNGSLDSWLHPDSRTGNEQDRRRLTVSQRMSIIVDVASALDYLHNQIETPILHSDLKPSNILLNQDMVAHVGDFGLSRIVSQDSDRHSSSVGLKGTFGYAAPEYGMGGSVSRSGDVYSFGIVVLEILTGKRPTDENFDDETNLNRFVKIALVEGALEKIIDLDLLTEVETEERGKVHRHECLVSMLRIGVKCSEETPRERLEINDALKECLKVQSSLGN